MSEETGSVEVEVEVEPAPESGPETVVDAAPVVIVEDSGEEGTVTEGELERAVEEAQELTALEIAVGGLIETVDQLGTRVASLEAGEQVTQEVVSEVVQEVSEQGAALGEEVAESLEAHGETIDEDGDGKQDEIPTTARKHWWFR